MPFLNRIRFVSVGHESARFDDIVLNLRGSDDQPSDSTIWLRNGGGKSSILNLFFAIVQPGARQFLGGRAESGERKLDHYVYPKDKSITAAEWQLEAGLDQKPRRLITGVFYERREGSGAEDGDLKRLFFGAFVDESVPAATLEGLPVYVEKDGKRVSRRALNSFKQEWAALRVQHPHLEPVFFDNNQGDWKEWLEKAELDPELFGYQLRMNEREGNADVLFRFKDADKFIDFLLGIVMDRRFSEKLRETIITYTEELHRRKTVEVPEHELLAGLRERIEPFLKLAAQRNAIRDRTAVFGAELAGLQRWTGETIKTLEREALEFEASEKRLGQQAETYAQEGMKFHQDSMGCRRLAARTRSQEWTKEKEKADRLMRAADGENKLWESAVVFRHRERASREAQLHANQLERQKAEHAPLLKDLNAAAKRYAGALKQDLQRNQAAAQAHQKAETEARQKAAESSAQAATCHTELSVARSKAASLRTSLKEALSVRKLLETKAILQQGESASAASERLNKQAEGLAGDLEELRKQEHALLVEGKDVQRLLQDAGAAHSAAQERERQATNEFQKARGAKSSLEDAGNLARALELETVDLDRLEESALDTLRSAISRLTDQVVEIKLDQVQDERAVRHLEESGLMPPRPDVLKLLTAIRKEVQGCWSGWEYIEKNFKPGERRGVVEAHPELACGVIVQDNKFEGALRAAQAAQVPLEEPIVLAGSGAFKTANSRGAVLGPSSAGHFDRKAATEEGKARQARLADLNRALGAKIDRRQQIQSALNQIQAFRQLYPKGWFTQQEGVVSACEAETQDRLRAVEAFRNRLDAVNTKIEGCRERRETASNDRQAVLGARQELASFVGRYDNRIADWERDAARLESSAAELDAKRRTFLQSADEQNRAAAESNRQTKVMLVESSSVERELRDVRYIDEGEVRANAGDTRSLATEYKLLQSQYEGKIGAEMLLVLIEKFRKDAREWDGKLQPLLVKYELAEEKVRKALASLENEDEAEQRQKQAASEYASHLGLKARMSQLLEKEGPVLEDLERDCGALQIPDDWKPSPMPRNAEGLEALGKENDREAATKREAAQRAIQEAANARTQLGSRRQRATTLANVSADLKSLRDEFLDLFGADEEHNEGGTEITEADLNNRKIGIQRELRATRLDIKRLTESRAALWRAVRTWADEARFERVPRETKALVNKLEDPAIDAQLAELDKVVNERVSVLAAKLEASGRNRELIINHTIAEADKGLEMLKAASRLSKLPQNFRGLGGAQFLKVDFKEPEDSAQRRAKIAELIDQWVESSQLPEGIQLIQQAVRKLLRELKVKVLHPDLLGSYADITEMGRFSGGESQTCAILLYCSLAQLRARSRGTRRPSSILILDNPIGRSSATNFLELQRSVAQAMRIQLIYTTGVNDYEAVRTMPNIIRLRNQRVNARTGHKIVELDAHSVSVLESVRIARREPAPNGN